MTIESRKLPHFEAGAVKMPVAIHGWSELIARDTRWEAHSHPTHELMWNARGASSTTVGARTWMITPAVGVWMPAGVIHSGRAPAGTQLRAAQLDVHTVPSLSPHPTAVEIGPLLKSLLERLDDESLNPESRRLTEAMVLDVLAPSPRELLVHWPQNELLTPILRALEEDPGDTRTLEEWSVELGVSSRTITRAFQAETGLSFGRWQGTVRAYEAALMLAGGWRVLDVAYAVGYQSASAFGAAFRRVTGLSPAALHPVT